MKRFIYISDIHGEKQDVSAMKAFWSFTSQFKPDIRICGGDLFDFSSLRNSASSEEISQSESKGLETGMDFLSSWKPTVFLLGNHDIRLWNVVNSTRPGIERDWAAKNIESICRITKQSKTKILPYCKRKGIYRNGDLAFMHGFYVGPSAVLKHVNTYRQSIMCGHCHTPQTISMPGVTQTWGHMAGCMCELDMEYTYKTPSTTAWRHGFCYGFLGNNTSMVFHATPDETGSWFFPTEWRITKNQHPSR